VDQDIIEHTIGEPIYVLASAPIELYDQLTNTWSNVANAQALGYLPSGKLRKRNAEGPVIGSFILSWPTTDLFRLKLDTSGALFVPGEYVTDIKIQAPSGEFIYSAKRTYNLTWAATR
jgi:hypothetical protein